MAASSSVVNTFSSHLISNGGQLSEDLRPIGQRMGYRVAFQLQFTQTGKALQPAYFSHLSWYRVVKTRNTKPYCKRSSSDSNNAVDLHLRCGCWRGPGS